MKYVTLVELRQSVYDEKMALVNFMAGRCVIIDQLSTVHIGHLPKNMYSIKEVVKQLKERIIMANNGRGNWVRHIPRWEKHIEYLDGLKTIKSKYHP